MTDATFPTPADHLVTAERSAAGGSELLSLESGTMGRAQVGVIALAVMLATLDGYDALAMAFAAPAVSSEWALGKVTLGVLLSSGLFGMAAGSLGLSPLADVIGRKPVVLVGIALMAIGSLLSAFCHSAPQLIGCRIVTGLGIGVMVALTTSIAAEFSNARNRPIAVAATTIGFSMGGVFGGLAGAAVLSNYGWPWIFILGALVAALLWISAVVALPESPAFIVTRRQPNALQRLNRVLTRLGHPTVASLPSAPKSSRASYRSLFSRELASTTVRFTVVYALVVTTAYFMLSWMPQLITEAGFPPSEASMVSAVASLVGVGAALIMGSLARHAGVARVAAGCMIGLAIATAAFGLTPPLLPAIMVSVSVFGFFLSGSTAVFYATMTVAYPASTRVSGIGFVMGVGRVLSVAGPVLAGWMFAAGMTRAEVSLVFAVGALLGGLLLITLPAKYPRKQFSSVRA